MKGRGRLYGLALLIGISLMLSVFAPLGVAAEDPLLPDLAAALPHHLGLQEKGKRELLRFTSGIANVGAGDLRIRSEPPPGTTTEVTTAVQELLGPDGQVLAEQVVGSYAYHPAHRHWHIQAMALDEVRSALDDGTTGAWGEPLENDRGSAQSAKVSFCLIDWLRMEGPQATTERTYWDCFAEHQGVAPGWIDQYHHSLEGQSLDVTGAPEGVYYLLTSVNPDGAVLEAGSGNNAAWVSFRLLREPGERAHLEHIAHSACAAELCEVPPANR